MKRILMMLIVMGILCSAFAGCGMQEENVLDKWKAARQKYFSEEWDLQTFLNEMKDETVYYSTLVGNDEEGERQLYTLNTADSDISYYPIFYTAEACAKFYQELKRDGAAVIEGSLEDFLDMLDGNEIMQQFGVVLSPNVEEIIIPPNIRVTK